MKDIKKQKKEFGIKRFLIEFFRPTRNKIRSYIILIILLFLIDAIDFFFITQSACFVKCPEGKKYFDPLPWHPCGICVNANNTMFIIKYLPLFIFSPIITLLTIFNFGYLAIIYFFVELLLWYLVLCSFYFFKNKERYTIKNE